MVNPKLKEPGANHFPGGCCRESAIINNLKEAGVVTQYTPFNSDSVASAAHRQVLQTEVVSEKLNLKTKQRTCFGSCPPMGAKQQRSGIRKADLNLARASAVCQGRDDGRSQCLSLGKRAVHLNILVPGLDAPLICAMVESTEHWPPYHYAGWQLG